VGRVLTRLEELGLADNTIVCFTGDNGGVSSGDSFSSSELPYRGGKGRQWEGGTRVLFYIKAPGVTRPGSTCNTPVKDAIWEIYLRLFELDPEQSRPQDDQWTGAEIRACCRLAALLDVPLSAAAQNVVPVAVTAAESVERLRTWATGRCLDAEAGGIYGRGKAANGQPRRKVRRDASSN